MVDCKSCGQGFGQECQERAAARISLEVMGDEYTESFFFCTACEVYTQETHRDRFLGDESVYISGPIARQAGDAIVAAIGRCPDPMNKKCRCPTHQQFR